MKKSLSLVLAYLLLISVLMLPSCGGGEAVKPTGVFRETLIELPAELSGDNVSFNRYISSGGKVYMQVYSYDPETYTPSYSINVFDINEEKFVDSIVIETEQNEMSGSSMTNFAVGNDGTLFILLENYSYGEDYSDFKQEYEVRKIKDGEIETLTLKFPEESQYGFYANSMEATEDGGLVLASWDCIYIMSDDGTLTPAEVGSSDSTGIDSIKVIDGQMYVGMYDYSESDGGFRLYAFDPASGTLGDPLDLNGNHIYNMLFGPGYDYYYNDSTCIWGVDIETGEMTEVVNFINSDINGTDISGVIPISPDRFMVTMRVRGTGGMISGTQMGFIDRVPEDEVVAKKMIRMAVNYASYDLRSRVIQFNKTNDTYRITIDDYSRYNTAENYSAGIEKLNTDIISGNIPDIFIVSEEMPYDTYVAKGVFADIYEMMDADGDFDRSLYLENVFRAYEIDGKLYSIIPSFYVETFAAKAEHVGTESGWTFEEFMEFAEAHPDMQMFDYEYNREFFVERFLSFSKNEFINAATGEVNFDCDEFRLLLTFASTLSEGNFWESVSEEDQMDSDFWAEFDNRFKEDRVLLSWVTVSDVEYSMKNLLNYVFGAQPTFIGFPVSEGNGAVIRAYGEYAISASSDYKDGAWDFLKTLISEDAQMPKYVQNDWGGYWNYPNGGLPIYVPALEKCVEIAMTERDDAIDGGAVVMPRVATPTDLVIESAETEIAADTESEVSDAKSDETVDETVSEDTGDESDKIAFDTDIAIDWEDPYATPLTREQADALLTLIKETDRVARYDSDLNAIISEELAPFFEGKQSLDDTVDHIQNRVSIYVNESR